MDLEQLHLCRVLNVFQLINNRDVIHDVGNGKDQVKSLFVTRHRKRKVIKEKMNCYDTISYSSAAATTNKICGVVLDEFLQCLPAVEGSPPSAPTKGCCGVIRKANLPCLCKYKSKIRDMGIDPVMVLALPKKCRIKLPQKC
ncbi:putative lipid-transfer protein DIR1 [Impatiens glandulifera]|uniref:putative lipid-transfer protein DIR1 n=1 Tax=Impatiens glandulifera TaxID=253017 RepID=UPI001FB07C4B|nr:putative lipid-transfer protein DIR1 [Impatiens glandulifera]